jgi:hypothetical protein
MSNPDLSLVSIDDLAQEMINRCDGIIILGVKNRDAENINIIDCTEADFITQSFLLNVAKMRLRREMREAKIL